MGRERYGRLQPRRRGPGPLDIRAGSSWGAASGGAERLWSQRTAAGLVREGDFEPGSASFEAEVGYGIGAMGGLLTPYTSLILSGSGETYRAPAGASNSPSPSP